MFYWRRLRFTFELESTFVLARQWSPIKSSIIHRLVRPVGVWCERVGPADGESEVTTAKRQLP